MFLKIHMLQPLELISMFEPFKSKIKKLNFKFGTLLVNNVSKQSHKPIIKEHMELS
jgi:hypothetical protein